jgi:hypothetical protein
MHARFSICSQLLTVWRATLCVVCIQLVRLLAKDYSVGCTTTTEELIPDGRQQIGYRKCVPIDNCDAEGSLIWRRCHAHWHSNKVTIGCCDCCPTTHEASMFLSLFFGFFLTFRSENWLEAEPGPWNTLRFGGIAGGNLLDFNWSVFMKSVPDWSVFQLACLLLARRLIDRSFDWSVDWEESLAAFFITGKFPLIHI